MSQTKKTDPFPTELNHLIRMAHVPGFKDHAWWRAKQLAKDDLFAGIDGWLVWFMKDRK